MTLDYEIYKEGGLLNDRYQKIEDISEGSYGYVSLAKDTKLKKLVAVKYIFKLEEEEEEEEGEDMKDRDIDMTKKSRKEKKSLVSEAVKSKFAENICVEAMYEVDIQTKLGKHRNIVELLDYFDSYIIMEYCSGGDLYEAIKDDVIPRRTKSITYILNQIADAVEFAHSKHIYHRDIKPENILITGIDWTVKLTDWGLATTSQTSMDRNVGSERYMAPELFESNLDIEERKEPYECDKVDLWAMGIVFLNIVFHKNPFKVANQTDKSFCYFAANREALFDVFSTMAYDFFQVLRYCLTIDPSNRSLSKMRRELDNLMEYTLDDEYYNSVEDEYDIVFSPSPEMPPPSSAPVSLPTPPTSMTSIGKPDNMRIDSKTSMKFTPSDVSPKVNSPLAPPSPATVAAPITTQATTTGTTIHTSTSTSAGANANANANTSSSTATSGAVDRKTAAIVDDKNIDFEQRPIFDTAKRNTSSHYHHYRHSPPSPSLLSVSPGTKYRPNNQNNNPRSGTSSAQHSPPENTHYSGAFKKHYYDIPKLQITPDYGPHANNNSGLSYSYGAHVVSPHYNDHNPRYSGYTSPNGSYHNYGNNAGGAYTGGNKLNNNNNYYHHYYYGGNNHNYVYGGNNKSGNYSSKYYHHRDGTRNGRRSSERSTSVPKFKYGRQPRRRNERLQSGSNNESERGSGHYPRTAGIKINGKNRTKIYTNARKPLGIPTPNTHITTFSKDYHNKVKNEKFNTRDFFTPPSMQNKYLEGVFETDLARHRVYFNNRPRDNSRSNNSTLRGWNSGNSQYKNRRPSAGAVLYYANSGGNNNNNNSNSNLSLSGRGKNVYRRSSYCTSNPVIPPNNTGGSGNVNSGSFVPPRMRTGGYHNNGSNMFSVSPYIPDISTVLDEPSKHVPIDPYGQNDAYTNEVNDLNDEDHESDGGLFSMETNDHTFIQGMQNLSIQDGGKQQQAQSPGQQQQQQQQQLLDKSGGGTIAHLAGLQISGNNFAMPISRGSQGTGNASSSAATGTTTGTATTTTSTTTAAGTLDTSKLPDLLRSPIVEEAQLNSMVPSQEISSFMSAMNALSRPNGNVGFGNVTSSQHQEVGSQSIAPSGNQLKSGVYILPHNRKQFSGFANEATLSVSNNTININKKNQQQTAAPSISLGGTGIGTTIQVTKDGGDLSGSGSSGDGMFQFSDNENVNNNNDGNDNDNGNDNGNVNVNDNDNLIFSAEGIGGAV